MRMWVTCLLYRILALVGLHIHLYQYITEGITKDFSVDPIQTFLHRIISCSKFTNTRKCQERVGVILSYLRFQISLDVRIFQRICGAPYVSFWNCQIYIIFSIFCKIRKFRKFFDCFTIHYNYQHKTNTIKKSWVELYSSEVKRTHAQNLCSCLRIVYDRRT